MTWTPTVNHSRYVALQLHKDRVFNQFFRAIPIGPGDGKRIRVNIFYGGSLSTPACDTLLSDTGDNKYANLTAYDRVYPKCFDHDDLRSFEWIPESRSALMDNITSAITDFMRQTAVTDWVTQFIAGYTNAYTLAAGNANFQGATAALTLDSMGQLGSAVDLVMDECGGDVDSMAIIFPKHTPIVAAPGRYNNLVNFSSQISTFGGNEVGFMSRNDGYTRFMGVKCFAVPSNTIGWGGTSGMSGGTGSYSGTGLLSTGLSQIAALVISNKTPGYAVAPVGQEGYVTSGDWADAIKFHPIEYDASTGMYRMNTHISFGMGFAEEAAVAIVQNPT